MTIAHSLTTSTSLSTRVARVEQHGGGGGGGGGDEGGGASRAADGSYRPRPQPQRHAQAGGCWAGASGYASGSRFGTSVFAIGTLTSCEAAAGRRRASSLGRLRQPAPPNLPGCPGLQGRDRTAAVRVPAAQLQPRVLALFGPPEARRSVRRSESDL
jgi:hypothetical protein